MQKVFEAAVTVFGLAAVALTVALAITKDEIFLAIMVGMAIVVIPVAGIVLLGKGTVLLVDRVPEDRLDTFLTVWVLVWGMVVIVPLAVFNPPIPMIAGVTLGLLLASSIPFIGALHAHRHRTTDAGLQ